MYRRNVEIQIYWLLEIFFLNGSTYFKYLKFVSNFLCQFLSNCPTYFQNLISLGSH